MGESASIRLRWAVFAALSAATLLQGTGVFLYDADHYWTATTSLFGLGPTPEGYWELRGALTPVVYAPAALATAILGPGAAGLAVLVENALLLGAVGAFLLPAFVSRWRAATPGTVIVAAVLLWMVAARFAPYPLADTAAAFLVIAALTLVRSDRWIGVGLAGVALGAAVNLRPAYLVAGALVLIAVAVLRWRNGLILLAGAVVATVPQLIVNLVANRAFGVLPSGAGDLASLQSGYASYTVRYDTILGDASARQFYCSVDMAARVADSPPQGTGDLILAFLQNLPVSAWFALQKVGAAVRWPVDTPYSVPTPGVDTLFGIGVTVVTVVGIAALVVSAVRRGPRRGDVLAWATVVAVALGSVITIVSSASEARFALPLVMLGVAGCASLVGERPTRDRGTWVPLAAIAVTCAVVLLAGQTGLSHPAPRGEATATTCARTG